MKKLTFLIAFFIVAQTAFAKKVKFAVDMDTITINSTGVHVIGNFQIAAGYAADWDASLTPLTQEPGTNIYSIVVDIPAFQKYEYKFTNGDQLYDVEFVPEKSRVGYDNNDDRWLYVDSLSNDTTFVGAVGFSQNAPAGKLLLRVKVNMKYSFPLGNNGVHVAGNYQNWSLNDTRLYSFLDSVYETIVYVDAGAYEYKYFNGNLSSNAETVPSVCATNNNRYITISSDTVLNPVCFSSCSTCFATGIIANAINSFYVAPNPVNDFVEIYFGDNANYKIELTDVMGRQIFYKEIINENHFRIERNQINSGLYFLHALDEKTNISHTQKIIFQ